ncbi:5,10-methenyltetrahydrofolate synthetase (5-formyltetrahydrofolate cyclo-ligase) [Ictalurus punctatus]|uniref:5-formyltetrahydrofolate cyclo-ligase n=1 Tax=Ictalurus punctatus TaxID=7998 RepID=E3TF09_ICTPU|nr:5,10-methenyltetrahydrofolate synthetase (5-formyltetrahydrofolate cyclo-ligase) [Ictalurus punctatus]ADO28895.1 5-formyltetrahydrofolate cyclo-ligase [Ictalurus punctatus]
MAVLRAAKQALRKEIKKRVAALSDEEKLRQSQVVSRKLFKHHNYRSSHRVAVFLSMHDEVRAEAILQHMFSSGKVCFIPRYQSDSNHMDMLQLNSMEDLNSLPITSWNIRQPADNDTQREEALATGGLDLILMPGLGFDKNGNRLGRGKGFYDLYLQRCMRHSKGKPYTIALAFKEQLCEQIPVDDTDILIDEVLCEDV